MPENLRAPELASIPKYEPSLETVFFEFSNDGITKQAASIKIPSMTAEETINFFNVNWASQIHGGGQLFAFHRTDKLNGMLLRNRGFQYPLLIISARLRSFALEDVPFARCVLHDEVGSLARTNLGFRFVLLPLELPELVRELPAVDDLREWTEANPRPMGGERHPEVIA